MTKSYENVTRVTVVSDTGVEFEKYDLFEFGVDVVLQDDGRTLKILPRLTPPGWQGTAEKYQRLRRLVEDGASLNEIRRTTGSDPRTVQKWFPDHVKYPQGGSGDAAVIRSVNQRLNGLG